MHLELAIDPDTYSSVTYWLGMAAVAAMAGAAVLEAADKKFDLFGVIVVALAAALGGGSLRDMLLDRPVFWIADQIYLLIALCAAVGVFFLARWWRMPIRVFLFLDALGLGPVQCHRHRGGLAVGCPLVGGQLHGRELPG